MNVLGYNSCRSGGLGEGIAGGDVEFGDFGGYGVYDGLEQGFVGQDDGGLATSGDAVVFFEPGSDVAGLDVVGQGRDDGDFLGCLLVCVLNEACLVLGFEVLDESLFNGEEQIETGKDILSVQERIDFNFQRFLDDLAIERAFVGQALGGETGVEIKVDIIDVTPEGEESLLEFSVVGIVEVTEEFAEDIFLLLRQI